MIALILLSVFLLVMVGIGIWGYRKTTSLNDFFLGGRSIGPWISAFAYGTSYFSAVLFIGFAGKLGWGFGLPVLWIVLGNALIGSLLAWLVLGARTRIMTQNLNAMTMPEFLAERFGSQGLKIFAAIIIFIFLLPYSASVFQGLGYLFQVTFAIPYDMALLIMIIITGVYLVLGGYFAITLTDFIQGIIMLIGSVAMVAVLTGKAGGIVEAWQGVTNAYAMHIPAGKSPPVLMLISLVFMTSFGVWGMPQMVQKFYAIKNAKVIPLAAVITTVFALVIVFSAYFTGAMSHIFMQALPLGETGKPAFDMIVPSMLTAHLPEVLMAVIMLLVLSASMSTLSSLVLVSASAIAIDLYKGRINPAIKKEHSLMMMRFLSAIFVLLSYFLARNQFSVIVTLMSLSWGAVAGSFMAPYFYGLFWKKASKTSIWAGMASGLGTSMILFFVWGPDMSPMASSMGMLVPCMVVPLVSAFTSPPDEARITRAFSGIGKNA